QTPKPGPLPRSRANVLLPSSQILALSRPLNHPSPFLAGTSCTQCPTINGVLAPLLATANHPSPETAPLDFLSATVARTKRIPVSQRAEAAVIAWMRHATTAYDSLVIARVKGRRREVRRALAERSRELLEGYRRGDEASAACPLARALS
ncbi:MAG: hypothetical protein ACI87O_002641, partial [Planctomycetota bacterium]